MNETIGEALHVLTHSYRHLLKEAAQRSGIVLPVSHIRSLKCIGSTNQCRARDICTTLRLDKSQVARILKALLNKGYIAKKSKPSQPTAVFNL
ncbi:winged helix DNA-binding protein [Marinomonas sp. IMCC 4694]|uniref:winged helix DNA-binding protein n=1 Tax=Marinomonas sp. IMCC 4694 TaxID=2605432 RepID=UPI0011E78D00|nr:winged helix DNA-binding protein [Marinomonas sp. IMCC 4694]TYL47799.1 MarR family transcriptional regulator [Marinomonas sp. IMCC 4694]